MKIRANPIIRGHITDFSKFTPHVFDDKPTGIVKGLYLRNKQNFHGKNHQLFLLCQELKKG